MEAKINQDMKEFNAQIMTLVTQMNSTVKDSKIRTEEIAKMIREKWEKEIFKIT